MFLYILGSLLIVLCGIQYKIILNLGTLQAQMNSMNNVTDGAWTEWGPWSSCSATCGGGLRSRNRTCTNLDPPSLGTYCGGESEQYELCSKNLCLDAELVSRIIENARIKIAFTAFLSTEATHLSHHQVIPFDKVILNEGQGFNVNTHIFTCPVSGTYNFQTSLLSTKGSLVITEIVKEGNGLVQAHAQPPSGIHVQSFNSVFTKCDKGENVWVRLYVLGDKIYSERYTTFSGFLL